MTLTPKSFGQHLTMLFAGLALCICLPSYLYIEYAYIPRLVAERGNAMHDLAHGIAAVVGENLGERQREISRVAREPVLRTAPLSSPEVAATLARLQAAYSNYSWIGVTDEKGVVRAATQSQRVGEDVGDQPWFKAGLEGPFIGDIRKMSALSQTGLPETTAQASTYLDVSAPVMAESATTRGVVGAQINRQWLPVVLGMLAPARAKEDQLTIFVMNGSNKLIYPDNNPSTLAAAHVPTALRPYTESVWEDGYRYLSATAAVRDVLPGKSLGWRVVVRQPLARALENVAALKSVLLGASLTVMIVFFSLACWSASTISRPLRQLARIAKKIQSGDERTPIDVPTATADLRNLVDAFAGMSSTLITSRQALASSNAQLEQKVAERTAELQQANEGLQSLARHDALTSLSNRRAANERLTLEFVRMKRSQITYCVIMIDIDSFKRINDTFGHADGDLVLQRVALAINASVRESDFVARYGGEEFLVILPATSVAGAVVVAERCRNAVAATQDVKVGQVTVSLGLAEATMEHRSDNEAVHLADGLLYEAKRVGKNRTISALPNHVRW